MDTIKHAVLPLTLLICTPVFANVDCKTIANEVVRQDQLFKIQAHEFTAHYDEVNTPNDHASVEMRRDFLKRLDALINTVRRDIDGMRWLIDHHCRPAKEEQNAIKSVQDMESALVALIVRRMDARTAR
jgi:hypothetical protein